MANWVVTATTIYCDAVTDEVTLIVNIDGTSQCTGYNKYFQPNAKTNISMKTQSKQLGKGLQCEGLGCYRVVRYRDSLLAGEGGASERETDSE